ncbi:MAG TPA: hypothetical protein VLE89_06395 [Chlamydiales bacterium]|nr:hypothetical protein [Chlamydiales bacterium]
MAGFVSAYNKPANYLSFDGRIDFAHPSPTEIQQHLNSYNSKKLATLAASVKAAAELLRGILKWAEGPKPSADEILADDGHRRLQCFYFSPLKKQSLKNSLERENRVLGEIRSRMAEFPQKLDFLQ